MDRNHPIRPPFDMMDKWRLDRKCGAGFENIVADATQWGADQELDACCEWLEKNCGRWEIPMALREARRPTPKNIKQQATELLDSIQRSQKDWQLTDLNIIRLALEQLDD